MPRHRRLRLNLLLITSLAAAGASSAFGGSHTPQPGTPERKAICDGVREYVLTKVATRKITQPIVFKVEFMKVDGGLAWFEGTPMLKSGAYAAPDLLPDTDYSMVLKQSGSGWRVIHDLSRTDVPDGEELARIRSDLKNVPSSILPEFWRGMLKR